VFCGFTVERDITYVLSLNLYNIAGPNLRDADLLSFFVFVFNANLAVCPKIECVDSRESPDGDKKKIFLCGNVVPLTLALLNLLKGKV
jgi:hypothetical protein